MSKTFFSDGNPLQGILGTIVNAAFLNKIFSHRHDGLDQDGSAPLDYAVDQGAANVYVVALTPALPNHIEGLPIHFKADNSNTGASTLNINGLGAKSIVMPDGSALSAGTIKAGQIVTVIYTGAAYMIVSRTSDSPIPSGTIIQVTGNTAPSGFIKGNGALLSRATYANLWAWAQASGNIAANDAAWTRGQYSPGDGATTFRIPDLRGDFIRNWDDGAGIDSGRTIGSTQLDQLQNITGGYPAIATAGGAGYGVFLSTINNAAYSGAALGDGNYTANLSFDSANSPGARTGSETRPRNTAYLACIKY